MSGTETSGPAWPLPGDRQMAWSPPGNSPALAAVPVTAEDVKAGLTLPAYRARLSARVRWMMAQTDAPEQAAAQLLAALEARGLWPGVSLQAESLWGRVEELLTDNPAWPDYLNLQVELPEERPMPVRPVPAALRAVQETAFGEWMDLVFATAPEPT